ncbi:MAG: HD domain-containing protein [Mogibacterium sp.]|nr:HD domain-containing protein [Mogibacterium sp.]MBR2539332.1 HD domain-containing protein [Mogibacterium sp.]
MKPYYIKDLKPDDNHHLEDRFLVRNADIRDGNNGKRHLYMTLADATGDIQAVKWTLTPDEIASYSKIRTGMIITVAARCKEYQGKNQLVIDVIKGRAKDDTYDRADFFKAAPESPEGMYEYILSRINAFEDEDLRDLCLSFYEDEKDRLMYYPAAMSNHHAEYAGLLYHVKRMMMMGERACEVYTFLNKDLLLAGVALHDIEKLNELNSDENGVVPDYTLEGKMLGHLVMGVAAIGERCRDLGLDEEKCLMMQHMALSHHYEPEYGSPKKPLFPEAEMLHYLDMTDAKMFDMEEALENVEPGEFSDKVYTLDNRKLYKRTF